MIGDKEKKKLKNIMDRYMELAPGLEEHCTRCLETRRWNGSTVLMVLDAAFTSVGLNYFNVVVPRVLSFEDRFVETGRVTTLSELEELRHNEVRDIWKNKRSWRVARRVGGILSRIGSEKGLDDREALRHWARNSSVKGWSENPIGSVNGVGIVTYQYLRMMGGVDTNMPDGVVRQVIRDIVEEGGADLSVEGDFELIETIELLSEITGYREVEITWMTWLVQSEGDKIRIDKYRDVLDKI
ncbi:hypothetical protein [Methanonatronarchaeum sp. AMET6-2]|uniref:hypothetical protein n=1 Tax=Methanonatronarchaeum sp. AMET6-2 TaxID=2933293 RepID=UPI001FF63E50|nr:hypothetical protein [Methanonatronarchaeum sp. AMET6-2]UOY10406.1 hypothetical protein MU439_01885 [Methanonatronarchaeum sp. AMET6-2]